MIYQVLNNDIKIYKLLKNNYILKLKEDKSNGDFIKMLIHYSNLLCFSTSCVTMSCCLNLLIDNNVNEKIKEYIKEFLQINKQYIVFIYNIKDNSEKLQQIINEFNLKTISFDETNNECKFFTTFKKFKK